MDKLPTHQEKAQLTALLGSPVAHSISPAMHNESFKQLGLDYVYRAFDVTEKELPEAVAHLKDIGIRGFNLTMPNKNKVIELVDHLSPSAKLIGAVNTVVNDDGVLTGYNTDGIGFIQAVKDIGYSIVDKEITILGNGGAATAIIAQVALDGARQINVFLRPTSRFVARTEKLLDDICQATSVKACTFDLDNTDSLREAINASSLLVNATSVGMAPDIDASPIKDSSLLHKDLLVADIIYNPRTTKLMQIAGEVGCKTCNGMYMLLYQGAEAFKLFTGHDMPVELIRSKFFN